MRVLIVENDRESREGLSKMVSTLDDRCTVDTAANGDEGLVAIKRMSPDLLFLDIRMPGMSGFDMLERIREQYPHMRVVIVSAFDHFPYAQRAIRLGVYDYIIKPCAADTIDKILRSVRADMVTGEGRDAPLNVILAHWLTHPKEYSPELAYRLHGDAKATCPGILLLFKGLFANDEQRNYFMHVLRQLADSLVKYMEISCASHAQCLVHVQEDELIAVLLDREGAQSLNESELQMLALDWMRDMKDCFGVEMAAAVGRRLDDLLAQTQRAYQLLRALLEYQFYCHSDHRILTQSIAIDANRSVSMERIRDVITALEGGCTDHVHKAVTALFASLCEPPYMPVQRLKYTIHTNLASLIERIGTGIPAVNRISILDHLRTASENAVSISSFERDVRTVCEEVTYWISAVHENKNSAVIGRCLDYLHAQYSDAGLSQEAIAQRFHFSPGYFGTLFKAETGQTFVQYLSNYRIEKARGMLLTTDMRVYEIAEKTGFYDFRYFIRVFKKNTGMSPNQYRIFHSLAERSAL